MERNCGNGQRVAVTPCGMPGMSAGNAGGKRFFRRLAMAAGAVAMTGLLAGCASTAGEDPANVIGNIFAFNSTKAPPVDQKYRPPSSVICPVVHVRQGGAAHRVYRGRGTSNQDVRYQFSIGQTARECRVENGQLVIRVGVEGKVLLGPAGNNSAFRVPIFIGVENDNTDQMMVSKVYQVEASIPQGAAHTTFSVVSEPLVVPVTREEANLDYVIYVSFERPGRASARRGRSGRRAARSRRR